MTRSVTRASSRVPFIGSSCRSRAIPSSAARLLACVVTLSLALACQEGETFFTRIGDSRALAAGLRVQFNQAADASNRAVMADTEQAARTFVGDAEASVKNVERDVAALSRSLEQLGLPDEIQLLEEFGKRFAEYRELDRTILTLAVDNTNLQAQRLAFGPTREAADRFREALDVAASGVPLDDRCTVEALTARAILAVREIQVILAPHIAESSDGAMSQLEQRMTELESTASSAVDSLAKRLAPGAAPAAAAARSALARFVELSRQIVALSRRNSDVRSLDLSLRTKPALTAACDYSLRALQDRLAREDIKATR